MEKSIKIDVVVKDEEGNKTAEFGYTTLTALSVEDIYNRMSDQMESFNDAAKLKERVANADERIVFDVLREEIGGVIERMEEAFGEEYIKSTLLDSPENWAKCVDHIQWTREQEAI